MVYRDAIAGQTPMDEATADADDIFSETAAIEEGASPLNRLWEWLHRLWQVFEVTVGLLICWFVAIEAVMAPLMIPSGLDGPNPAAMTLRQAMELAITLLALSFFGYIQANFFQATWNAVGRPRALSFEFCRNTPRVWPAVRPLVAAWWLGHVALCLWIAASIDSTTPTTHVVVHTNPVETLFMIVTGFAFSLAANIFMLQTVAVFNPTELALDRTWKLRLLIDGGVLLFPLLWHMHLEAR